MQEYGKEVFSVARLSRKREKYGCYHSLTGISHIHVLNTLFGVNLERECTGTGHQSYL